MDHSSILKYILKTYFIWFFLWFSLTLFSQKHVLDVWIYIINKLKIGNYFKITSWKLFSQYSEYKIECILLELNPMMFLLLNLLGYHWLITYKFQMYNFIIQHVYALLYTPCPKSSHFVSPCIWPPLPASKVPNVWTWSFRNVVIWKRSGLKRNFWYQVWSAVSIITLKDPCLLVFTHFVQSLLNVD